METNAELIDWRNRQARQLARHARNCPTCAKAGLRHASFCSHGKGIASRICTANELLQLRKEAA